MKKWHKWIIAVLVSVAIIAAGTVCVYKFYAKDKIEGALEKAQAVLQDETLKKEVETFVEEMVESGELDSSQLEGYLVYKEADSSQSPEPSQEVKPESRSVSAPTPTPKPKTLMERIRAAMTAEEFAFAMAMYGKIDVNYCFANYYTDRAAVKKHIKSVLTSSEISRSLEIYGKYSYLLK
ncbi:MAG: hypothetical protein IJ300_04895 [Clostridia bacterium]|nr:hypothetical protein [Clostridia bacterium]